jgi:hypothetical protein
MGEALLKFSIIMSDIECIHCHTTFAVTKEAHDSLRQKGNLFWCPLCHGNMVYNGGGEVGELKKKLAEAERQREWHKQRAADERLAREQTERRLSAQRSATKRVTNRVKNGVCPCCTRTFANLRDHMKTKHPNFTAEKMEQEQKAPASKAKSEYVKKRLAEIKEQT